MPPHHAATLTATHPTPTHTSRSTDYHVQTGMDADTAAMYMDMSGGDVDTGEYLPPWGRRRFVWGLYQLCYLRRLARP